jgi:hypothetical protein
VSLVQLQLSSTSRQRVDAAPGAPRQEDPQFHWVWVRDGPVNWARWAAAADRSGSARTPASPARNNGAELLIH